MNGVFLKDLFFNSYLNVIRINYSFEIDDFMSFKVFPLKADILRKLSLNSGNYCSVFGLKAYGQKAYGQNKEKYIIL